MDENRGKSFASIFAALERIAFEFYHAPYRGALIRSLKDEEDLFLIWVFSESIGIPNPLIYHCLELQPLLLERFHDWHRRLGLERSPFEHIRCC